MQSTVVKYSLNYWPYLKRDVHLNITAGRHGIHDGGNPLNVQSNARPLRSAQYHKGESAACEILLIPHIVVGCQKHVEPGPLRLGQQVAVGQPIPASIFSLCDHVPGQERS
ncbi:hypothetical protein SBA4_950002 [Candidatus Sulfopaludibacter sp. SbA4]|nr:hypothetical protein SBA4_950002 [Candidatus Sulfopaludibacter sp. SbA4]